MLSEIKTTFLKKLYQRYDEINSKLQRDFVKSHYDEWEIEDMKNELKRIDELIEEFKGGK